MDLTNELLGLQEDLRQSVRLLHKNGIAFAQAEKDYQVIKAQTVLKMKTAGATMSEINLAIKGQPEVAKMLFERDRTQVMYEANKEHINSIKLQMRIIEAQIQREWGING